jgi:nucleotide-binding universal stress UspA family protein
MKTILIPVDFSATSDNALKYAAEFSCDNAVERIILLKTFYVSIYEQILPSADFVQVSAADIQLERNNQISQLNEYKNRLSPGCKAIVEIELSEEPLLRAIHSSVDVHQADLLMVGSDGAGESTYIGELVISIAKSVPVPVLVIPSMASYQKITNALVACDFRSVAGIGLLKHLKDTSMWLRPELSILNIDPDNANLIRAQDYEAELETLLEGYRYEIFYTIDHDIVRGILDFASGHDVQLIVALPKKHSFFYNLTNSSISQALTLNAEKPVLILK